MFFKKAFLILSGSLMVLIAAAQTDTQFKAYEQAIPGTNVKFKMTPIPAGTFTMGSGANENGRRPDEGPQKKVKISPFWMGIHEVTYDEFLSFFNDESVSRNSQVDAVTRPTAQYIDLSWGMGKQGGFPFNSMSQHTALMYCKWLYKKTGVFYRLPTEAEWEYACRAGSESAYFFGNDTKQLDQYAWHAGNSKGKYQKVGQKKPNAWGLYDMHGNLSEWTLDQYDEKFLEQIQDGQANPTSAPAKRYPKTVKGGGYGDKPEALRCAARIKSEPAWNKRDPQIPKSKWWLTDATSVGFRIVRPLEQPTAEQAEEFFKKYSK
jgi:formylglycine-generating enzyme required for sulfatase activity